MNSPADIALKVCGMRDHENILELASLQPEYMGFIFYDKSPRFVGHEFVIPGISSAISKVGVFVNESTEKMLAIRDGYNLAFLQLHGSESPAQLEALQKEGVKIIKVFSVDDDFDFMATQSYEGLADFFLFDTKGKYYGGNAQRFNWTNLEKYNQRVPFFLSGGIGPENVSEIAVLTGMNIHALDINSGVELSPALKDLTKVSLVKNELTKINKHKKIAL